MKERTKGITKRGTLDDVIREPSVGGSKRRSISLRASLAALDSLIRGWPGFIPANVASAAAERIYSASPRAIMISAKNSGGGDEDIFVRYA